MSSKLSSTQQDAINYLTRNGGATRWNFYTAGIRMPTVYSLVKRGLVKHEKTKDNSGRTKLVYLLAPTTSDREAGE